jgi:hypothetical protein
MKNQATGTTIKIRNFEFYQSSQHGTEQLT